MPTASTTSPRAPDVDHQTGRCPYCDTIAAGYPDLDAWASATVDRLASWGFNTLGAWSDTDLVGTMPYTVLLYMAGGDDWFAPEFEERAAATERARWLRGVTTPSWSAGTWTASCAGGPTGARRRSSSTTT